MQVLDASQCSQCLGVEAERVRPRVVVPDEE